MIPFFSKKELKSTNQMKTKNRLKILSKNQNSMN